MGNLFVPGTTGRRGISKTSGFTLIELLVVISIIALLLAILMPVLRKARESAKTVQCGANLKQVGIASFMYCENNDDALVPERGYGKPAEEAEDLDTLIWAALLAPYVQHQRGSKSYNEGGYWAEDYDIEDQVLKVFKCPAQKDRFQFTWYLRYGVNLNHVSQPFHPAGPKLLKLHAVSRPSARLHIADSMDNVPAYEELNRYTQRLRDNLKSSFGYGYPGMAIWPSEEGRGLGSFVLLVGDRHSDGSNCLFLDGHVGYLKYSDIMFKKDESDAERAPKVEMWDYREPKDYFNW